MAWHDTFISYSHQSRQVTEPTKKWFRNPGSFIWVPSLKCSPSSPSSPPEGKRNDPAWWQVVSVGHSQTASTTADGKLLGRLSSCVPDREQRQYYEAPADLARLSGTWAFFLLCLEHSLDFPEAGRVGGGAPRIPQSVPPIQVLGPPGDSPSSGLVCPLLELQPKKWERQVLIPSHSIDKDRITVINTLIRKKNRDFLATDSQGHLDLQGSNLSLNLGEPWSDSRAPLQEGLQGLNFSDSSPSSLFGVLSFPK